MCPSFFAYMTEAGIACAADTDHTIYRLSEKLPLALAVNPDSPIPWDSVIESYKLSGPIEHVSFEDYAYDFARFLKSLVVEESWKALSPKTSNIIFLGYGSEDIFPTCFDVHVSIREDGRLDFDNPKISHVSSTYSVCDVFLGDFESVRAILRGMTSKMRDALSQDIRSHFDTFSKRLQELFADTEYEDYVRRHLEGYDIDGKIHDVMQAASRKYLIDYVMGVDSFSMEELVTSVERIVNANAKLSFLRSGGKGQLTEVREIAVVTIPEGLSWIKHSIHRRRTEI